MSAWKTCEAPIKWRRLGKRGWLPYNLAGERHFCGTPPKASGPHLIPGKEITGPKYTPSCGECATPPWETCACSARLAA